MKSTFFICLLLIFTTTIQAQPFNTEVHPEGGSPLLLGKINQDGLSENTYGVWFQKNKTAYTLKPEVIETLKEELSNYTITLYMGTWCGDSKREVPRFYKLLEAANFPMERLTAVAVSRDSDTYKQSPGGEHEGVNIHRVPTFIVYKDGKEVNRIVESPVVSLEEDLSAIIQGTYTSNYHGVTLVHDAIQELGLEKFRKKKKKLVSQLKEEVTNWYELNTYSYTLFQAGKKQEAIEVATLNILLYPNEAKVYENLGNKLKQVEKKTEALENYEKALGLNPENEKLKANIALLKKDGTN